MANLFYRIIFTSEDKACALILLSNQPDEVDDSEYCEKHRSW